MPARCSSSDRNSPAGPAPTIPTCVRIAVYCFGLRNAASAPVSCLLAFDVGGEPRVEVGEGVEHLLRRDVLADVVRDLLHLADEAIGLGVHRRDRALQPGQQRRLAALELGAQPLGARRRASAASIIMRAERGDALGDAGVGHLHRRGGADRAVHHVDARARSRRASANRAGVRTGRIDPRPVVAGLRRPADDADVDERRAGLDDDMADLDLGRRAHRVAIDIDRLVVARPDQRRHLLGQRQRVARRQDRQEIVGRASSWSDTATMPAALAPLGARPRCGRRAT